MWLLTLLCHQGKNVVNVTQRFSPAVEKRRASALNSLIPDKKELDSRMQYFFPFHEQPKDE